MFDCLICTVQVRRTLERLKGQLRERTGHTRPKLRLTRAEMSFLPLCLCCWASVLLCRCYNTGVTPPKSSCYIFLLRRDWPLSRLNYMYQALQCGLRKCYSCLTNRVATNLLTLRRVVWVHCISVQYAVLQFGCKMRRVGHAQRCATCSRKI